MNFSDVTISAPPSVSTIASRPNFSSASQDGYTPFKVMNGSTAMTIRVESKTYIGFPPVGVNRLTQLREGTILIMAAVRTSKGRWPGSHAGAARTTSGQNPYLPLDPAMVIEWNVRMFSADQERYPLHPE